MITTILLGLAGYCVFCYGFWWFYMMGGHKSQGCGFNSLANLTLVFAPILVPVLAVEVVQSFFKRIFS